MSGLLRYTRTRRKACGKLRRKGKNRNKSRPRGKVCLKIYREKKNIYEKCDFSALCFVEEIFAYLIASNIFDMTRNMLCDIDNNSRKGIKPFT